MIEGGSSYRGWTLAHVETSPLPFRATGPQFDEKLGCCAQCGKLAADDQWLQAPTLDALLAAIDAVEKQGTAKH